MTDKELDENRLKIVQDYLKDNPNLHLEADYDISVYSSKPGVYHVFMNNQHQYSMSDNGLENLVKSLKLGKIKEIYIATKVSNLTRKIGADAHINPLDHENYA